MESKGNDALLKTTKVTEWNLHYGGYVSVGFGGFILLGCVLAYIIAVARGNVEAILPLISDAAGSPPQNGLFGTLLCLGGMFGVVFMIQRYMIVLEKNKDKSSLVGFVNRLSMFVGIFSMLGITLITGYPVNFYRNRDVWLMDVGLPHMIGGIMLFALGLVYIALQCVLTLFLQTKKENSLPMRVLLLFICTAAFVYHMITVPEHFGGISHLYYLNNTENEINYTGILPYPPTMGASLKLPIDTSGSYVPSAIAQWIFVIFFSCFFFTFFNEAQEYSMLVVIETHTKHEPEEDSKMDFRKLSQTGSQGDPVPPPEVRKFLRRDSTCQTTTGGTDVCISPSKDFSNGKKKEGLQPLKKIPDLNTKVDASNGTKKLVSNAEVEAKLTKLISDSLEEDEPSDAKKSEEAVPNGHEMTTKEDQEKEEERVAIEKIDVVVKDAEVEAGISVKSTSEDGETMGQPATDDTQTSGCPLSVQ